MFPVPLHACPLSQRPDPTASGRHCTVPLGFGPPPQHALVDRQKSPVRRQPPTGWHTVAPEPKSTQTREQQLVPPEQGLPSWMQPPPPPPLIERHTPAPPSFAEHTFPQQSLFRRQTSPVAWQLYARTQTPPWQLVEQQSAPELQAWPITLHVEVEPGMVAQLPDVQVAVQQSVLLRQPIPTSKHCWDEHWPFKQ